VFVIDTSRCSVFGIDTPSVFGILTARFSVYIPLGVQYTYV
jgi:hypothetical protein